jgi:hypothetical protein
MGDAMGTRLEWTTGSHGLRRGVREDRRYTLPSCLHAGAALVAISSPVFATLIVLCAALLVA